MYSRGYRLEKEDTGSYEKEFMVSVDGEEAGSLQRHNSGTRKWNLKNELRPERSQELTEEMQQAGNAGSGGRSMQI